MILNILATIGACLWALSEAIISVREKSEFWVNLAHTLVFVIILMGIWR